MSNEDKFRAMLARLDKEPSRAMEARYYGNPENVAKFESEKKGGAMDQKADEVQHLLDLWADWMRKPEPIADGYPAKASGGFIESWRKDSEDLADAADADRLEKINAAFDSLAPIYRNAINRHYGLGHQVWRFAKGDSFDDAKVMIRVKFVMKGLL